MPIQNCQIDNKSGFKWGNNGKCYTGPDAKQNAIKQAIAIGEYNVDTNRVSFDYDETLSTQKGQDMATEMINNGKTIYIVTRRQRTAGSNVYKTAQKLGIPSDKVYFTNGKLKWETIKRLNIGTHYDNNQNEIDKINENTDTNGILFKS